MAKQTCPACNGFKVRTIEVPVPAGARADAAVKLTTEPCGWCNGTGRIDTKEA